MFANILISEPLATEGHSSRSTKLEEKEHKREMDGAKEKERYKEKYMGKSIQELDLSDCKRCTPSYRLLPADVYNFKSITFLIGFVKYTAL
jgi:paired amphipathic helix protein Sin3a